jgi:hypothetical protein
MLACTPDPGFLNACWTENRAVYSCSAGQPVVWEKDRLPLRYFIGVDPIVNTYKDEIKRAAQLWNREVGRTLFEETNIIGDANVIVREGSVTEGGGLAATYHYGDGTPTLAMVEIRGSACAPEMYVVMAHEFGHVLGLADDQRGLMGPITVDYCSGELFWVLPTDSDRALLRRTYR